MTVPLAFAQEGKNVRVQEINSGLRLKKRLGELGIYEGTRIMVMKNESFGPMIIKVFDSKLVLGRGESLKIMVE